MRYGKPIFFLLALPLGLALAASSGNIQAQTIPQMIPYTGTIEVNGTSFNGNGQFKFAIVSQDGSISYWSNDNTSVAGSEPTDFVTLSVNNGVFTVKLGDVSLTNMQPIAVGVFDSDLTYLRVWFNDGVIGFQPLSPDRQLASVPYAYRAEVAENVTSGGVTSDMISDGAVTTTDIADGTIATGDLAFDPSTQAELDTHKSSADHDGRYYTETELSAAGTINAAGNPVDWTKLKGVPTDFADGIDNIGSGSLPSGTSGQTLRHNGTDWTANSLLFNDGTSVGIGTTSPAKPLHVAATDVARFERTDDNDTNQATLQLYRSRSSATAPGASFGAQLRFLLEGFTDNSTPGVATISALWETAQTNDTTDRDTALVFETMQNASRSEQMRITSGGNVGIGTTSPGASALLDLSSTTQGFLSPRMTTVQRDAIASPATGLLIYNTTTNEYNLYNGTSWTIVGSGAATDVVCTGCVDSTDITDGTIATGDLAFDPATQAELDTHKSSADHDGRYYTETELNTSDGDAPNVGSNRIHWDNLNGVPAGFADGTDDTGGAGGGWTDDGTVVRLTTSTDSVGIGTTTPSDLLTVVGGNITIDATQKINLVPTASAEYIYSRATGFTSLVSRGPVELYTDTNNNDSNTAGNFTGVGVLIPILPILSITNGVESVT